jgi:hypothetical protein
MHPAVGYEVLDRTGHTDFDVAFGSPNSGHHTLWLNRVGLSVKLFFEYA